MERGRGIETNGNILEGFGRKEERDDVVKVGGKMRRAGQDHYGLVSHTGCGVRARVGTLSEVAPDDGAPVIPMSVLGILPSPPSLHSLPSLHNSLLLPPSQPFLVQTVPLPLPVSTTVSHSDDRSV